MVNDLVEMYDGPPVADDDIISVYVVLNGALEMSAGKALAQVFHTGWLAGVLGPRHDFQDPSWDEWIMQGRRVVTRVAETAHVFTRVQEETECIMQMDEGLLEVDRGSITALVTRPYRRNNVPKILSHKKVQLA